ncbi:MAG: hypothetical protein N2491_12895 [Negativicutes bacterium]|nr:hypothetical protein [Negativicutes bacterium]
MALELLIMSILIFLTGYVIGKKVGIKQGYREGAATTPLLLRQQSLEQGRCCFCHSDADEKASRIRI